MLQTTWFKKIYIGLAFGLTLASVWIFAPQAHAANLIIINKTISNGNTSVKTDAAVGSVVSAVSTSDVLSVSVSVTNYGSSPVVTISDSYAGFDRPVDAAWTGGGGSFSYSNNIMTVTSPSIVSGSTKTYTYKISPTSMPSNKPKLIGLPVSSSTGFATNLTLDIAYVMLLPSAASGTFVANTYNNSSTLDLSFVVPGVSVSLGNTTLKSADTVLTTPKQDSSVSSGNSQQCDTITINGTRGGSCLYNTTATVSANVNGNEVQVGSSSALVMTVPPSAIVGNIKVGGSTASVGDVLLPGQHTASNTDTTTAQTNINYSIDTNSVSGLSASGSDDAYGNLYLNANLAQAKRNPDFLLDKNSYTVYKSNINKNNVILGCMNANCSTADKPEFKLMIMPGAKIDLSSASMSNNTTTPKNPKNGGYLWYVKGNLTITKGNALGVATNLSLGTIFVDGNVTLSDVVINNLSSLGIIATGNIYWQCTVSESLQSIAFFTNKDFYATTSSAQASIKLTGSIVARGKVDFSGVVLPENSDALNLYIVYDQNLTTNPPPRMSKLASPVSLNESSK